MQLIIHPWFDGVKLLQILVFLPDSCHSTTRFQTSIARTASFVGRQELSDMLFLYLLRASCPTAFQRHPSHCKDCLDAWDIRTESLNQFIFPFSIALVPDLGPFKTVPIKRLECKQNFRKAETSFICLFSFGFHWWFHDPPSWGLLPKTQIWPRLLGIISPRKWNSTKCDHFFASNFPVVSVLFLVLDLLSSHLEK